MKTFDGFPGHRRGEIELRFAKKDAPKAQELSKLVTHKLKTYS
jgi:hypothetical protein